MKKVKLGVLWVVYLDYAEGKIQKNFLSSIINL